MDLLPSAKGVYPDLWALATYAAAHKDQAGNYSYQVTDLVASLTEIGQLENRTFTFEDHAGVSSLFGIARTMERAADRLTAAPDAAGIDRQHISEPPWSRSLAAQNAAPEWQLRAEITYRAPDGSVITTWGTGIFQKVLPATVGAMRAEATLQFQRMLSQRSEEKNTGGELLSIGRQYLLVR